jgi:hypothetical protein
VEVIFIVGVAIACDRGRANPAVICGAVAFMAVVAAVGYRYFRLGVIIDGDEAVVRNYYLSHRIRRDQVSGFGRGRPSMGSFETITIETGFESIPLDVLAAWQRAASAPRRPSRAYYKRENALAVLSDWAQTPADYADKRLS